MSPSTSFMQVSAERGGLLKTTMTHRAELDLARKQLKRRVDWHDVPSERRGGCLRG